MTFRPLPVSFYQPSAEVVAPQLLGHWLIRQTERGICGGAIVETEAYMVGDPASHGFSGQTARNRVMYGPPGFAYVYFIYGNHFCVNAVCRPQGQAEAVLIRAIEVEFGLEIMQENRPVKHLTSLTNGPGKLCASLDIDRALDGASLCDPASPLMIAENPNAQLFRQQREPQVATTRVGISRAAEMPLRFYLDASDYVSKRRVQQRV